MVRRYRRSRQRLPPQASVAYPGSSSLKIISQPQSPSDWLVACLCAEWCDTCRVYRDTLIELAGAHPGHRFAWIDIEDDAELAGDLDIEDFPTLLVMQRDQVRFYGTVLPHAGHLSRLLEALAQSDAAPKITEPGVAELARELQAALRPGGSDRPKAP